MKLREKLPEMVLEAAMVVFAVLVALGVEEWREDKERQELARRATLAIAAEFRANIAELEGNRENNQGLLEVIVAADQADERPPGLDITFEYSLISSAAWETAQITQATHYMELEDVQSLSRIYNLQRLYQASQDEVMDFILNAGSLARNDPESIPGLLRGPLNNTVGMEGLLVTAYESLLPRLDPEGETASVAQADSARQERRLDVGSE